MITTTKYALKIPEADDSADLRIYVGDNMTILDAHKHLWADITDKPTAFVPQLMGGGQVGGARVGNGLGVSGEYLYVKIQNGISLDTNTNAIQIDRTYMDNIYQLKGTTSYVLPKASPTVLGGIMVGTNLTIDANGVLSSTQVTWDTLTLKPLTFPPPLMQTGQVGGARVGNGLGMSGEYLYVKNGTGLFIDTSNYSIAIDRTVVNTWYDNYQGWDIKVGATTDRIASTNVLTVAGTGATTVSYDATTNTLTINSTGGGGTVTETTWARNLFSPFVFNGFVATKSATVLNQFTVDFGVAYLKQTNLSLERRAHNLTTYTTTVASTTYYFDMNPDGTISFATTHSAVANSLPILTVTTDATGNVGTITDVSNKVTEMFPLSTNLSVKTPPNGLVFGNFQIQFNSATNSLDFNFIG